MEAYAMLISQGKKKRKYSITMLKKKKEYVNWKTITKYIGITYEM